MTKDTQLPTATQVAATEQVAAHNTETADTNIIENNIIENSQPNAKSDNQHDADNGVNLVDALAPYFRPDEQTIVCGALDEDKIAALAKAGVELVINLQPDEELSFDEAAAVAQAGMYYQQLPIGGANDLKQLKILAFDNILRQYHGKKIAIHCGSGNRAGAAMALRAGWLRGRKMETAMERGRSHGLTTLAEEVHNRLLVPR